MSWDKYRKPFQSTIMDLTNKYDALVERGIKGDAQALITAKQVMAEIQQIKTYILEQEAKDETTQF